MALTATRRARIESRLDLYYAAEEALLRNESYKMPDGRELTRVNDLKSIQAQIEGFENQLDGDDGTPIVKGRVRRGVIMNR